MTNDLNVGDEVEKVNGDYRFRGHIVAVFLKRSSQTRYVVENPDGILHIFSRGNLTLVARKQPANFAEAVASACKIVRTPHEPA